MEEGVTRLSKLLSLTQDQSTVAYRWAALTRLQLQVCLGTLNPEFPEQLEETISLARSAGDLACLAEALNVSGVVKSYSGLFEEAVPLFEEAVEAASASGYHYGQVAALNNIGAMFSNVNQFTRAKHVLAQAVHLASEHHFDSVLAALALLNTEVQINVGDHRVAEEACQVAEALFQKLGSRRDLGFVALLRGIIALWQDVPSVARINGNFERAEQHFQEAERLLKPGAVGQQMDLLRPGPVDVLIGRGQWAEAREQLERTLAKAVEDDDRVAVMNAHFALGRVEHGEQHYLEALLHFQTMLVLTQYELAQVEGLEVATATVSRLGYWEMAASIWGATARFREQTGLVRQPYFAEPHDRERQWTRQQLGQRAFDEAFTQGKAMSLKEAVGRLLSLQCTKEGQSHPSHGVQPLN